MAVREGLTREAAEDLVDEAIGTARADTTRIIARPMHDHEAALVRAALVRAVVKEENLIVGEVATSVVPVLRAARVTVDDYGPGERAAAPACAGPWPMWLAVDADMAAAIELQQVPDAGLDAVIGVYRGGQRYRVRVLTRGAHDAVWSTPGARVVGRL